MSERYFKKPAATATSVYSKLVFALITACSLMGLASCGGESERTPPKVEILSDEVVDEVIVDKSFIVTTNPERYQPSYNLEGSLVPVHSTDISSPFEGTHIDYLVKEGDWVKKGQKVARMQSNLSTEDIISYNHEGVDIQVNQVELAHISNDEVVQKSEDDVQEDLTPETSQNSKQEDSKQEDSTTTQLLPVTLTFYSLMEGEVTKLKKRHSIISDHPIDSTPANTSFLTVANTNHLKLIGQLPLSTESHLSVGQTVNFTVIDSHTEFAGQISRITPKPEANNLTVEALIVRSAKNNALLDADMQAMMTIEYGQTAIGVRLPRRAISEASLDTLTKKHTRPRSPIEGFVWVIHQDQTLQYTPIEVVEYFPESDHFLVHGINNNSLVCIVKLPRSADGKKISIE